ncbi:NTF2-like N-terminal transpeptidase domain-containing protein [Tumebacillus flagellatus]|uniref:Uncharacterized protein n=1 Tax=Tumebacillus flagellatus TaxID=1157490 RepID=A0A074M7Q5_9BACL|nr:NTF2-like N-terminal transpeptidase domain-containing protein [Tumebacillus flagellatus]KEO82017.1 hypothetical protein EL26_17770 [Tumebacillus flagellatus]
MKKSTAVLSTLIALGIAGGLFLGVSKSGASSTPEQEAKQAVTRYLDAVKKGNVDEMMKSTIDKRFTDDATKRDVYESFKNDPVQTDKTKILSINKVDNTHLTATIRISTKGTGTHDLTIPVQKDGEQWKLVIDGQEVTKNND